MDKIAIGFTPAAQERVMSWLADRVKNPEWLVNREEWLEAVLTDVCDRVPGKHEPEYELPARESKDGMPKLLSFRDSDFDWGDA